MYTEKGGARIGRSYWLSMNATWPLATISISEEAIELSALCQKRHFDKIEISGLQTYTGFISSGIQIIHTIPRYSKFVVFWSMNLKEFVTQLRAHGYNVD
jgi:hypothetical protein